jgi:hypothetical protein
VEGRGVLLTARESSWGPGLGVWMRRRLHRWLLRGLMTMAALALIPNLTRFR